MNDVQGTPGLFATISDCGKYRYRLGRMWGRVIDPTVLFVMLNPSTADAVEDDNTIRRCTAFAKAWGFGHLLVGNMFAYRSTDPYALLTLNSIAEAEGPENDEHLEHMATISSQIICAWGTHGGTRFPSVLRQFAGKLYCLGRTKHGMPKHPLYLPKDVARERFAP